MSRFFIHRPVFAGVIAIVIVLAGFVASKLPRGGAVSRDRAADGADHHHLPGASAETLARTVAAPIEEQLSGVEKLSFFSSTSSSTGSLHHHRDLRARHQRRPVGVQRQQPRADRAAAPARRGAPERRHRAEALVRHPARGVRCSRRQDRDTLFLSNYQLDQPVDELKRLPGIADVTISARATTRCACG
jgi:multidrug efflux pump subunit AcrB